MVVLIVKSAIESPEEAKMCHALKNQKCERSIDVFDVMPRIEQSISSVTIRKWNVVKGWRWASHS